MYPLAMSLPASLGINLSGRSSMWLVVGGSFGEMVIPLAIGELIGWRVGAVPCEHNIPH
jgi:hypothetical protein